MVLSILGLVFLFLFLALSGWYAERGFEAVVQILLVGGLGKATTELRRRPTAENRMCVPHYLP